MKLSSIHTNPDNPRIIKDDKFKKLVTSISEFPKMMELRPIIVDENGLILGGNMRFKALQELKYKDIPDNWVKRADELTEEEKERFIIEDNLPFGEWDWDILANEWDEEKLIEWGLDLHIWDKGVDANNMTDGDVDLSEQFDPVGKAAGVQRVVFIFDDKTAAEQYLNRLGVQYKKMNMAWQVNLSTLFIS